MRGDLLVEGLFLVRAQIRVDPQHAGNPLGDEVGANPFQFIVGAGLVETLQQQMPAQGRRLAFDAGSRRVGP